MDCVNVQRDVIEGWLPRDMLNDIIRISLTAPFFPSMQSIFGRNSFYAPLAVLLPAAACPLLAG